MDYTGIYRISKYIGTIKEHKGESMSQVHWSCSIRTKTITKIMILSSFLTSMIKLLYGPGSLVMIGNSSRKRKIKLKTQELIPHI